MKCALGIDEKCYELAKHFLQDMYATEGDEQLLAGEFQQIAETFCREIGARSEAMKRGQL